MRKRYLWTVFACAAVLLAFAYVFECQKGPRYQGRALGTWLMVYYESDRPNRHGTRGPAAAALREAGTNAIPTLLEWMRYETPGWHRSLASCLNTLPWKVGLSIANCRPSRATVYRRVHRAGAAETCFRLLGTNAVSAVPALTTMLQDGSHPETASRARAVLRCVNPQPDSAAVVSNVVVPPTLSAATNAPVR